MEYILEVACYYNVAAPMAKPEHNSKRDQSLSTKGGLQVGHAKSSAHRSSKSGEGRKRNAYARIGGLMKRKLTIKHPSRSPLGPTRESIEGSLGNRPLRIWITGFSSKATIPQSTAALLDLITMDQILDHPPYSPDSICDGSHPALLGREGGRHNEKFFLPSHKTLTEAREDLSSRYIQRS